MTAELWTWNELIAAMPGCVADGRPAAAITGFSIDTRSLSPGDVFVALQDQRDGHEFVTSAAKAGAAAAIVARGYQRIAGDGALLRVDDPLRALEHLGVAARARLPSKARVIAVTGSAGKTGTKDMLRACLGRLGKVHASEKSYNNHWGVPLTLVRMPADTQYAVFEIGMNHPGEIRPLVKLVRPHAAIITTVEAVHLAHFNSVEEIADAKAEIFSGLEPGGSAIIKRASPYFDRLAAHAHVDRAKVISFGLASNADVYADKIEQSAEASEITARIGDKIISYRLAIPGSHVAENSLAVAAALQVIGADVETALGALAGLPPPDGRGARVLLATRTVGDPTGHALLIDESYNANPASMRAALATLANLPRDRFQRRIVVLGDMLELGVQAGELHRGLKPAIDAAGADLVFACGPNMKGLYDSLRPAIKGSYGETAAELEPALLAEIRARDVVMVKGSNGLKLGALVGALRRRYGEANNPL